MDSCIFCKISSGAFDTKFVYESDLVVAFNDIAPQAPVHVLVVPKVHIDSMDGIDDSKKDIAAEMLSAIPKIAKDLGIVDNYRVISNCGESVGQSVKHLHFHIMSGSPLLKERII